MDFRNLAEELEDVEALDKVAVPIAEAVDQLLPDGPTRDALRGKWLGHPLHPVLTDLPIGFWTTAFVFDLLPFRGSGKAARTMIGLGTLAAVPTLATGWADWSALPERQRRPGLVHAVSNGVATALYASSYVARRRGRTFRGVALAMLGAGAATFGGYLGGELVYRLGAGVTTGNQPTETPDMWSPVLDGGQAVSEPVISAAP